MPRNATKKATAKLSRQSEQPKATILINLFDGTRELLPPKTKVLLRIIDGEQRHVFTDFVKGPTIRVTVPFQNGMRDTYTVLASADGYVQAGFHPVRVSPTLVRPVFLMLLPRASRFDFSEAQWDVLEETHPALTDLFLEGAVGETQAQSRYDIMMEQRPANISCLLNILTVMQDIDLPQFTPLDYLREIMWDETMAQDRFFAWADPLLVQQVRIAAAQGAFAQEPGPGLLHPGATSSYKQVQFGEANLQITFHETSGNGQDRVKVELDIDYFKDMTAHALLEVIPGFFELTDPKRVYVLRWIAGHQANVPSFNPPYTIRRADA
jgi:hypothetical protein